MKYLIVGLGNIGSEYINTRHNIGFKILDALANASNISFQDRRYAFRAEYKYKGRTFILIKPSTFMNLSGKAVNFWLQKENRTAFVKWLGEEIAISHHADWYCVTKDVFEKYGETCDEEYIG